MRTKIAKMLHFHLVFLKQLAFVIAMLIFHLLWLIAAQELFLV